MAGILGALGVGNAAAGLATGGLSLLEYGLNKRQAKKDEANRPKYAIPAEVAQGLNEAERQALQGMPEEQRAQAVSDMQRSQSYSLGQNSSRKGGLANIAALNENQNQGYANLASASSQMRFQKQQNVFNQLNNVADYKGQEFQINQENPYYEKIQRNSANRGALFQNLNKSAQLGLAGSSPSSASNGSVNPYTGLGGGTYGGTFGKGTANPGGFQELGTVIG